MGDDGSSRSLRTRVGVSNSGTPVRHYLRRLGWPVASTQGNVMPKYLCLQRKLGAGNTERPSPAQMQEMYAKFGAWQEKFRNNLVDLGGRLGKGTLARSDDPTDGPFVEVKELVGGYMIVSAESLELAVQVARECPGLVGPGSGVEVIEIRTP